MFKIASVSGAPPQTPWGSLRRSPRPPSREGLLAFGNHNFAPSALNPSLAPQTKIPAPLAPQTQNPRTATVHESQFTMRFSNLCSGVAMGGSAGSRNLGPRQLGAPDRRHNLF